MSEPRQQRIDLILQQLEQLPTLPTVAVRVLELTGKDESSARQVVELIQSDPSLASRMLALVRRAEHGVRGDVATVERAVVLLGFESVRCAALAISIFQTFAAAEQNRSGRFDREEFWKHSLAVACCAELLAEQAQGAAGGTIEPSEAFVCGLLHDIGKVALATILPKSFDRVVEAADLLRGDIADVERTVIGLDHMIIGKRLAEQWQLPAIVRDCVWLHGQKPQALPASVRKPRLVNLVTLADLIVREQHLGYSGNYAFSLSRAELMQHVRINDEAVGRVCEKLIGKIEQSAGMLGLGRTSSGELYHSALSRANQELGRMTQQLVSKNKRLAIRAKFFDALAQFQGELRPDAAPSLVLQAIGQTAASTIQASGVAVFSKLPGRTTAELVLVDSAGDVIGTSVLDCPARIECRASGEGPVLSAGEQLEWVLSAISPRLDGNGRFWICLDAEGECIGGVVWGAAEGESEKLSGQSAELSALAAGWALALRTAQIRDESRTLAEQLAEANRQLQNANLEVLHSRTLSSVGEMAAGAAHEMNNPLAVISGRSQLLANQLIDPKQKQAATAIWENSHRLSQIITDLMEFAKPVPPNPQETDLSDLIDRGLYEARNIADPGQRHIEVRLDEVPPVAVDPQQVQSAFAQILHNAFQATDEVNGEITIHAAYDPFSSRVAVSFTDNGRGMDEQTLKRAFDPFFSSQSAGRRRGLGLAKALRWVESSGGTIRLESSLDHGTRATVLLPAARTLEQEKQKQSRQLAGG